MLFFIIVKLKKKTGYYPVIYDKESQSYVVSKKKHGYGDIAESFSAEELAIHLPKFLNIQNFEKAEIYQDKGII